MRNAGGGGGFTVTAQRPITWHRENIEIWRRWETGERQEESDTEMGGNVFGLGKRKIDINKVVASSPLLLNSLKVVWQCVCVIDFWVTVLPYLYNIYMKWNKIYTQHRRHSTNRQGQELSSQCLLATTLWLAWLGLAWLSGIWIEKMRMRTWQCQFWLVVCLPCLVCLTVSDSWINASSDSLDNECAVVYAHKDSQSVNKRYSFQQSHSRHATGKWATIAHSAHRIVLPLHHFFFFKWTCN